MHTCRRIGLCPADLARAAQRIPGSRRQSILVPCTPEFPGNNFQVLLQATGHPAEVWFRRAPREGEELLTTPSRLCNRATRSHPQTRTHLTRTPPNHGRDARQRVCGTLTGAPELSTELTIHGSISAHTRMGVEACRLPGREATRPLCVLYGIYKKFG